MGIYRRKDKNGKYYGPWIIQYPYAIDPMTGKVKYTTKKVGYSKRLAERAFAKRMLEWEEKKHLGFEIKKRYTFGELIDWYLGLSKVKAKKSYRDDLCRSRPLKEAFGRIPADEIKPSMVEEFQHGLLKGHTNIRNKPLKPATVNRIIALMKRIYNLAMREELVDKNPCFKVSMLPENNKRDRVLSHEEFKRLISHLPEHAAQIVKTAYYTGMRAGEIFNLTWDKVNLKEGYIELSSEDTKTSEPRRIYLVPELKEMFLRLSKVRHLKHNHVFTYNGVPVKEIKRSFKSACKKAGIEDFRFHDLRHTFITNMRKAGVERSIIMKITGHKTMSMFERYNTVDSTDAQDALKRLGEFLTKPATKKKITSLLLQSPSSSAHDDVSS